MPTTLRIRTDSQHIRHTEERLAAAEAQIEHWRQVAAMQASELRATRGIADRWRRRAIRAEANYDAAQRQVADLQIGLLARLWRQLRG